MKARLELRPAGVQALVALCHHVAQHGSFASDGRAIAQVLLAAAEAEAESAAWRREELERLERGGPGPARSMRLLRDAVRRLFGR